MSSDTEKEKFITNKYMSGYSPEYLSDYNSEPTPDNHNGADEDEMFLGTFAVLAIIVLIIFAFLT